MNTNETIEYEIPTEEELDVSVQGAERRGYRAGVEAMQKAIEKYYPEKPAWLSQIAKELKEDKG